MNNLPTTASSNSNVDFYWTFEDCGNVVIRMCDLEVDGVRIGAWDGGVAVGEARREAKAWAKSIGAMFNDITEECTFKDYRYAQLECNARNR